MRFLISVKREVKRKRGRKENEAQTAEDQQKWGKGGGIRVPLFLKKELQKWPRPLCPHQRDLQKGVNQKR